MALGVSAEELGSDYEIPVTEDHLDYKAYVSLVSMYNNLQSLLV
jgi:hypothetical protein